MVTGVLPAIDTGPAIAMRRLLFGQLLSRAVQTLVTLGVPELLADGPRTVDELARLTGTQVRPLRRLLTALVVFDVVAAEPDDHFGLTPLGATLRQDVPASAAPTALLAAGEVGEAWDDLRDTVRTGRAAFERTHGEGFFDHLRRDATTRLVFDRSQEAGLMVELPGILAAVGQPDVGTVVDVGGGDGALLAAVLTAEPTLRGVLLERSEAVAAAADRIARAGLADRCRLHVGDFFQEVPGGAGVYLLRHILHDWDDDRCVALLRRCAMAMDSVATLLVIETVPAKPAGTGVDAEVAALMDLYMMSLFDGGRERSLAELTELFAAAGLDLTRVTPLPGGAAVMTAVRR
ncbi:methyltransferase [Micromonospora zingiberis]|uniref:Methyltransferase n=1 Tax=Micromonospora zingiberis TaxID=2053011 RepID=A0A4R0GLW7_9ACTN|nr:methyltransferase [Micromonospora zingiberis]TCB97867.1 methyltransferase [Micromonospora zingiberis]